MFLRHGVFRGAAFRFLIRFGSAFPRAAPQVQFVAPVPFHPCVNADTGVVSFKFDDKLGAGAWSPETHFVFELLVALKRAFCALDDINALSHQVASNHEACALLARDRDEFVRRARLSVDAANEAIDLSVKQNGIDINVDVDVDVDDNDNDNKEVVDSTTTTTTVSNPADEFSLQFTPFDQRHEAFWTELQSNGGKSSRSPMSAAVRSFIRSIFD
jgi:ubiquitin-protein ligase